MPTYSYTAQTLCRCIHLWFTSTQASLHPVNHIAHYWEHCIRAIISAFLLLLCIAMKKRGCLLTHLCKISPRVYLISKQTAELKSKWTWRPEHNRVVKVFIYCSILIVKGMQYMQIFTKSSCSSHEAHVAFGFPSFLCFKAEMRNVLIVSECSSTSTDTLFMLSGGATMCWLSSGAFREVLFNSPVARSQTFKWIIFPDTKIFVSIYRKWIDVSVLGVFVSLWWRNVNTK